DASLITTGRYTAAPQAWWKLLTDQGVSAWVSTAVVVVIALFAVVLLATLLRMAVSSTDTPSPDHLGGDEPERSPREVVRYR
ncbi:MAG TPA: hypothetical protein VHU91_10605, partial [Mycobacteriales bacterium]|nr:hypothetical protein [Mycobacteriales bacterium]